MSAPAPAWLTPLLSGPETSTAGGLIGSLSHPVAGLLQAWLLPLTGSLSTLALSLALLALLLVLGSALGRLLGTHQWGIPEALLAGGLGLLVAPAGLLPLIPPAVIQLWDQLPLILLTLVFASLLLGKPLPALGGLWRPLSAQMLLALTLAFGQYLVAALAVLLVLQPLLGAPSVMACLIEVAYEGGHGSAAAMGPTYARLGLESGEALGLALATVGLLASTLVGGLLVLIGRRRGWTLQAATDLATPPTHGTRKPPGEAAIQPEGPGGCPAPSSASLDATRPQATPVDPPPRDRVTGVGLDTGQPPLASIAVEAAAARDPEPIDRQLLRGNGIGMVASGVGSDPVEGDLPAGGGDTANGSERSEPMAERTGQKQPAEPVLAGAGSPLEAALSARAVAVNLALTGSAVLIGVVMLEGLRLLAVRQGGLLEMVVDALPVFPLALLGSLLVRLVLERTGRSQLVLPKLQSRIGTLSADLLISAATACLDLSLLARDWLPLTVLAVVGLLWNLAVILLLAPRILPANWFERGLVEFGQATGVAASGLLLLNMVDPEDINGSLTPFSIKQLILQPFLAGGVITVVAPLAVDGWGLPLWSAVCLAVVIAASGLGLWLARSVARTHV